jgi:hypothetical protein
MCARFVDVAALSEQLSSDYSKACELASAHADAAARMREVASRLGMGGLKGRGFDALKTRLEEHDIRIAEAMGDFMSAYAARCKRHRSLLRNYLYEGEYIDIDMIEYDIRAQKALAANLRERLAVTGQAILASDIVAWENYSSRCNGEIACCEAIIRELESKRERFESYCSATAGIYDSLESMMRKINSGMLCVLGMSYCGGVFATRYTDRADWANQLSSELIEAAAHRFMPGFDPANPSFAGPYDWAAIAAVLALEAGAITSAEYKVLAMMLAAMGLEDTARFVQRLAVRGEDVLPTRLSGADPYTNWSFDTAKLGRLTQAMLLDYSANLPSLSRDAIGDYCMKLSVLASLPSFGMSQGSGIHSAVGADFPPITLTAGDDGSVNLGYFAQGRTNVQTTGMGGLHDMASQPFTHYSVTFSASEQAANLVGEITARLGIRLDKALAPGALDAVGGAFTLVGLFPVVGSAAGGGSGVLAIEGMGYRQDVLNAAKGELGYITDLSKAFGQLGCMAVISTSSEYGGAGELFVLEGRNTNGVLADLNSALETSGIRHNLGSPVTLAAALGNPCELGRVNIAFDKDTDQYDSVYNQHSGLRSQP